MIDVSSPLTIRRSAAREAYPALTELYKLGIEYERVEADHPTGVHDLTEELFGDDAYSVAESTSSVVFTHNERLQSPRGLMMLDLDEILSLSAYGFLRHIGVEVDPADACYDSHLGGKRGDYKTEVIGFLGPVGREEVAPIDDIDEVKQLATAARDLGVSTVINTAATVGTRRRAIAFVHEHLGAAMDGIVFSGGHEATTSATKADGLADYIDQQRQEPTTIAVVDDTIRHVIDIRNYADSIGASSIDRVPLYPYGQRHESNADTLSVTLVRTPIDAIRQAYNEITKGEL